MQYRKMGKLGIDVSALGFGCMRLPALDDAPMTANVDKNEAIKMIRHAIENGIDYFDTAYFYHRGESERVLGLAIKDGYRQRIKLATKAPMAAIKTAEDYDRILDDQLQKLGTDHIDFYLFHGLNKNNWEIVKNQDLFGRAEAAQKAGKIGNICFSFHDKYDVFEKIINGYDKWAMCQIQYNFMDTEIQAGTKGLSLANSKGIGVAIMEPLRGGKLSKPIKSVQEILEKHGYNDTLTNLSLKWLWSQPGISVILSGMSNMEHINQNVKAATELSITEITKEELSILDEIKAEYRRRSGIPCTGCAYCMPCPQGVNIPQNLAFYDEGNMYENFDEAYRAYFSFGKPAGKCIGCKECEEKCPQSIKISEWLPKIHKKLDVDLG